MKKQNLKTKKIAQPKKQSDSSEMYKKISKNLPDEAFRQGGDIYLSDGMWLRPDGTMYED